jgi:hypothetical protein
MRGVHPPVVALLLCVLALPVLVAAATSPARPVEVLAAPAATAAVPSSEPPVRAATLPGSENSSPWYYPDAVLELAATVLATGVVAIVVLKRLP